LKLFSMVTVCLAVALSAAAVDDCAPEMAALHAFYDLRSLVVDRDASTYEISSQIDEHLDNLRGPLPDGGYEWVRFVRPKSGTGPVIKREHLIAGSEPESFEGTADHVYSVKIVVPRKRSLLKGNKEAWVGEVAVRYWVDGEEEITTKKVNQWMKPDTSKSYDLGVIADRAEAVAEVSTRTANESLAEIHFVQAVAQDDPESPHADTVERLKKLAGDITPRAIDEEIAKLEYQIFGRREAVPVAQIVVALREADELIRSDKEEEQEEGRKLLRETMRLLR
jgi:hypothetical protein